MGSPGRIRTYLARSEAARRIHYRLRYEVYCRETGFEPAEQHPEGIERDAYDEHAEHFLISHEGRPPETRWVGAMRLILPGKRPLPTTTNCRLFPEVEADADVPAVEVSRLIVRGLRPRCFITCVRPRRNTHDGMDTCACSFWCARRSRDCCDVMACPSRSVARRTGIAAHAYPA